MDRQFFLPADVDACCRKLTGAGHAAHPVGGAVRDLVLGRVPVDWDVASSARPETALALFGPAARPSGLPHGTVTVDTGLRRIEITTFRREGPYSDGRRPDWVAFVDDLETDLVRRDFTMNAMALDEGGGLIDPFGGRRDLERRVIRTVGDPSLRFREDGLRMYRGARFSAQLDFALGSEEEAVLRAHPDWGGPVSAERIRVEVEKGLCAPAPARLEVLFSGGLMARFLDRPAIPPLASLAGLPPAPPFRWAGLCAAALGAGAIDDAEAFLRRFHMDRRTLRGSLEALARI